MPRGDAIAALKRAVQDANAEFRESLGPGSQRAVDSLLRLAGYRAGMLFVNVFLPKRGDPSYARGPLGYRASVDYEKAKRTYAERNMLMNGRRVMPPQPRPFIMSGDSMRRVLESAQVEVRAYGSKGRMTIRVRCDAGNIKFTPQWGNFTRITDIERQRVLREFNDQCDELFLQTGRRDGDVYTSDFRFSNERKFPQGLERSIGA
jgi:hypothetical protein